MDILLRILLGWLYGIVCIIIGIFITPKKIYYAGDIEDLLIREGMEIKTAKKLSTAITEWLNGVGTQWG